MAKKKTTQSKGTNANMEQTNRKLTPEEQETLELFGNMVDDIHCGPEGAAAGDAEEENQAILEEAAAQTQQAEITEALAAALAKQEEYLDMAQRVQADFDNFRRRNQNMRKEAFDDGAGAFIISLLPVVDNMERALHSAQDSTDQSLREGVEMVYRQMMEVFSKRGVSTIDRKGEPFDPNLENAVMQAGPEEGEPGTVCEVMQKGYVLGQAVLRHAMVRVVAEA